MLKVKVYFFLDLWLVSSFKEHNRQINQYTNSFRALQFNILYFSVICINSCIHRCCQQEKSIHAMSENGKKTSLKTDSGQRFHVRILTTEIPVINNLANTFENKHKHYFGLLKCNMA